MRQSSIITTRSYRIYLRDSENRLTAGVDVDFASDDEAREHAAQMLDMQAAIVARRFGIGLGSFALCTKKGQRRITVAASTHPADRPTSPSARLPILNTRPAGCAR